MARLPQPGGDEGQWGAILNDFLSQTHKTDGTFKDNSVPASALASNAVDVSSLAAGTGTDGQVLTKDTSTSSGLKWATVSGSGTVPSASATTEGTIRLAGDLSGTATAPTVPGLANKANLSHTHAIADVTNLQTTLDGKAATTHTHAIADVTGLQTALDGKQAAGSYATATHTHTIANVTNLQTSLDGKLDDSQLDTDNTLATNSDSIIASQKAVKGYVDAKVVGSNMYVYQNYADAPALPVDTVVISRTGL